MKKLVFASVATTAFLAAAVSAGTAQAAPLFDAAAKDAPRANIVQTQLGIIQGLMDAEGAYLFGGHRYCWYPDGWRGPGWYWCGYAHRDGLGYGGREGWNGWGRPGERRRDGDERPRGGEMRRPGPPPGPPRGVGRPGPAPGPRPGAPAGKPAGGGKEHRDHDAH